MLFKHIVGIVSLLLFAKEQCQQQTLTSMEVKDFCAFASGSRIFYRCIFSQKCGCNDSTRKIQVGVSNDVKSLDSEEEKAKAMMAKFNKAIAAHVKTEANDSCSLDVNKGTEGPALFSARVAEMMWNQVTSLASDTDEESARAKGAREMWEEKRKKHKAAEWKCGLKDYSGTDDSRKRKSDAKKMTVEELKVATCANVEKASSLMSDISDDLISGGESVMKSTVFAEN